MFLDHFKTNFQSSFPPIPKDLDNLFPDKITESGNTLLYEIPSDHGMHSTIKQIPLSKSPSLDGFKCFFYKQYLHIVKDDLNAAIKSFFIFGHLLKEMNHTHIVLIPKTNSPSTFYEFRPICLSNICYKINTKILSNRLKQVMHKFISPYQTAFLPRKFIQENTILA